MMIKGQETPSPKVIVAIFVGLIAVFVGTIWQQESLLNNLHQEYPLIRWEDEIKGWVSIAKPQGAKRFRGSENFAFVNIHWSPDNLHVKRRIAANEIEHEVPFRALLRPNGAYLVKEAGTDEITVYYVENSDSLAFKYRMLDIRRSSLKGNDSDESQTIFELLLCLVLQ